MPHRSGQRGALGVLVLAASLLTSLSAPAIAAPAGDSAKARPTASPVGTYAVGRVTETFVDDSRPTPAFGSFAGAPSRTLETLVYYPARGSYVEDEVVDDARPVTRHAPYPLIVFSHGVTANAGVYEAVITPWVSAGYVVAAPNYPLSSTGSPGGNVFAAGLSDVSHQPADASFVIDEVIASARQAASPLRGLVDRKHIGVSGHSLGGITTLGVSFSDCCIDERIDAAAPMSGLAGLVADGRTYFDGVETPLLVLHGDRDGLVPYQTGVDAFTRADGPRFLVTFTDGGHVTPFVGAEGPQGEVLVESSLAFWDRYLKRDADGVDRLRETVTPSAVATLQEQERPT